jgi:uncharacterized protein (DUF433 family)
MERKLLGRIEINPKVMASKPVIKGTRIPVEMVLRMLSQGISVEELLEEYPHLAEEDIQAARQQKRLSPTWVFVRKEDEVCKL